MISSLSHILGAFFSRLRERSRSSAFLGSSSWPSIPEFSDRVTIFLSELGQVYCDSATFSE